MDVYPFVERFLRGPLHDRSQKRIDIALFYRASGYPENFTWHSISP